MWGGKEEEKKRVQLHETTVDFTVLLTLLFWALMGPSCKHVLGPLPGYPFAVKLTIWGRHARHRAQLSPQNDRFWTVDSYHLVSLSYPSSKSDGKQDARPGNRSGRMLREMGPGSLPVPGGQRLQGSTRSGGASRTRCLHAATATAGAFRAYKLNHLSVYYYAGLNPGFFVLKLCCPQSKPGIRLPARPRQAWGARAPTAIRICLLAAPPQMQTFHCQVENSESYFSSITAPKNKKFAFLTALHIEATRRSIFIKLRSSRDLPSNTERQRLRSPASRQHCWSAVLGQQHPSGDKDVGRLSHSLHKIFRFKLFEYTYEKAENLNWRVLKNYYFSH